MNKKQLIKQIVIILVVILGFVLVIRMDVGGGKDFPGDVIGNTTSTEGWKENLNTENGISFLYPEDLGTKYIHGQDWPPTVGVIDQVFSCTEPVSIFGNTYCVIKESEGAAGSVYDQYAFAKAYGNQTLVLIFSLKQVQCGNYDEPKKSECEVERTSFDINPIVDKIFETI